MSRPRGGILIDVLNHCKGYFTTEEKQRKEKDKRDLFSFVYVLYRFA